MIIEYSSELYPEKLREINNPPSRIYALGNIDILNDNAISVIGSRTNSEYGKKMCEKFTKELVQYKINIVSGLAIGIDGIAHKTCLKNGGKTIAVLPSGFKHIYPEQHKELAREILENDGVLISEYEPDVKPDSNKFILRNRIVSALSLGTLVIEAGYRSGTSVTAKYAREQGKKVFCIPSSLENIKGKTTNELIRNGAILVTNIEDILNEYKTISFIKTQTKYRDILLDIPEELIDIYKIIDNIPKDINEITKISKQSINEVNYKIVMLESEGVIQQLPGQRYIRNEE